MTGNKISPDIRVDHAGHQPGRSRAHSIQDHGTPPGCSGKHRTGNPGNFIPPLFQNIQPIPGIRLLERRGFLNLIKAAAFKTAFLFFFQI